jgi:AcrR family transcriptional regulator
VRSGTKGADREDKILEAAVDIFNSKGYAATSVDDVADAVGILKGSLYYYIKSKEDLLLRIVEEVHQEAESLLDEVASDEDAPPLERISRYVRAQIEYTARNIKRVRVYYHDFGNLGPDNLAAFRLRRKGYENAVAALIVEAKKKGEIPADVDAQIGAKTVFAVVTWMYTWFRPGGSVSGKRLGDFCADFVVSGLRGIGS